MIKLNVYLRDNYFISRREADRLIAAGKVKVNGQKPAPYFDPENDQLEVDLARRETLQVLAYYKPRGLATQGGTNRDDVVAKFKPMGFSPIGRLDKESEGLLLLTNNGSITDRLLNPKYDHSKVYLVTTRENIRSGVIKIIERGMVTEKYGKLKAAKAEIISPRKLRLTLSEGKNHQIRIMLAEMRLTVESLKRVEFMSVKLEQLKPGQFRHLKSSEIEALTR